MDQLRQQLAPRRAELRQRGVRSLRVFGSVARGEASEASDVDLLVEFSEPIGLFAYAGLQADLEDWLGVPVDLVTESGLRPEVRPTALAEAVLAA
ncbi:MAG: nucleotidyltransferase family protein [Fimbriimonadaceae bacterium]|nr:nucleotidyltransferase family protein [Fimbriimonadaceae bacterium]